MASSTVVVGVRTKTTETEYSRNGYAGGRGVSKGNSKQVKGVEGSERWLCSEGKKRLTVRAKMMLCAAVGVSRRGR